MVYHTLNHAYDLGVGGRRLPRHWMTLVRCCLGGKRQQRGEATASTQGLVSSEGRFVHDSPLLSPTSDAYCILNIMYSFRSCTMYGFKKILRKNMKVKRYQKVPCAGRCPTT